MIMNIKDLYAIIIAEGTVIIMLQKIACSASLEREPLKQLYPEIFAARYNQFSEGIEIIVIVNTANKIASNSTIIILRYNRHF